MNAIKRLAAAAFLCTGLVSGLASFAPATERIAEASSKSNVSFSIVNDWGADYMFCVNGAQHTISVGQTKTMSYSAGTEVKYVENGNCTVTWFEISGSLDGKTIKLSELIK